MPPESHGNGESSNDCAHYAYYACYAHYDILNLEKWGVFVNITPVFLIKNSPKSGGLTLPALLALHPCPLLPIL